MLGPTPKIDRAEGRFWRCGGELAEQGQDRAREFFFRLVAAARGCAAEGRLLQRADVRRLRPSDSFPTELPAGKGRCWPKGASLASRTAHAARCSTISSNAPRTAVGPMVIPGACHRGVVLEDTVRRICDKHTIVQSCVRQLISGLAKTDIVLDVTAKRVHEAAARLVFCVLALSCACANVKQTLVNVVRELRPASRGAPRQPLSQQRLALLPTLRPRCWSG
jgi:hypothetical protein